MVAVALFAANACRSGIEQAESNDTVPIRAVYHDQQCRRDTAGIQSIGDAEMLADWWRPLAVRQFPAQELPRSLGAIDFERSAVFIVFMGRQPTAGFDIELFDERATVQGATLTIPANWQKPPPDMPVAQVMTSPCVAMTVPAARYDSVVVRDRPGNVLLEARY